MNEPFFDSAPTDCVRAIVSFLPIKDCLVFGATTKQNLLEIQPELRCRRSRFTQTFFYNAHDKNPKVHGPIDPATKRKCTASQEVHVLPTIRDRIQSLWSVLSSAHPLAASANALLSAVKEITTDGNDVSEPTVDPQSWGVDFPSILATQTELVLPHKLHARLLRQAIQSQPTHCDMGYRHGISGGSQSNDGHVLTVELRRYIGDVLCAFYLMGHSAANIIEGGPTENDWIDIIQSEIPCLVAGEVSVDDQSLTAVGVAASTWYRCWVFVQSTLLRTAPFTWGQQVRLCIGTGILDSFPGDMRLRQHRPFAGFDKTLFMRRLALLTNFESLRVNFNDFGPLGPMFRGRDLIQSHTVYPSSPLGVAICFSDWSQAEYEESYTDGALPAFLHSWSSGQDAIIQWLLVLHTESTKSRPITVAPHLVTIRCSTL
jgi:hypothetical protein